MNKIHKIIIGITLLIFVFILFIAAYIKTSKSMDERKNGNSVNKDLVKNLDNNKNNNNDIKESKVNKPDKNKQNEEKEKKEKDKSDYSSKKNDDTKSQEENKKNDDISKEENNEDKENRPAIEKPNEENKKPEKEPDTNNKPVENRTDYQFNPRLGEIVDGWYVWPSLFETEQSAKSFGDDYLNNIKYIEINSKKYYFNEYKYDVLRYKDNTVAGTRIQFKLKGNE